MRAALLGRCFVPLLLSRGGGALGGGGRRRGREGRAPRQRFLIYDELTFVFESQNVDILYTYTYIHTHTHSDLAQDYFDGIRRSGLYKGFIFPVLAVDR